MTSSFILCTTPDTTVNQVIPHLFCVFPLNFNQNRDIRIESAYSLTNDHVLGGVPDDLHWPLASVKMTYKLKMIKLNHNNQPFPPSSGLAE